MAASEHLVIVTDKNFDEVVKKSAVPVILDFWADWCGPCRMVAPTFAELAAEFKGKVTFGKVNVDENGQTAQNFQIQSIPAFVVIKNGVEVHRFVGARDKDDMKLEIQKFA